MEILNNLSNEFAAIEKIQNELFEVERVPLIPSIEGYQKPTHYGIYREGGDQLFGVTGKVYRPTQPKDLLASLTESMLESGQPLDKLQYRELKEGKMIRFRYPLGEIKFTNKQGKEDVSEVYANLQTGFDGYTKTSFYVSTFRLICANGMKASVTEFKSSFKNTLGNQGKAVSLLKDLGRIKEQSANLQEFITVLNARKVTQKDVNEFMKRVTGYDFTQYNDLPKQSQNVIDQLNTALEQELERTGRTYWGLVNGITNYTNHYSSADNTEDYIYIDGGKSYNDKAMKVAREMALS